MREEQKRQRQHQHQKAINGGHVKADAAGAWRGGRRKVIAIVPENLSSLGSWPRAAYQNAVRKTMFCESNNELSCLALDISASTSRISLACWRTIVDDSHIRANIRHATGRRMSNNERKRKMKNFPLT